MTRFKHMVLGRNPLRTAVRAGVTAALAFVIFGFVLRVAIVKGVSMEPTLHEGQIRLVNLLHYRWQEPRRGDVAAVSMPGGRSFYVKRILGLPGETIAFEDGALLINGRETAEPYLTSRGRWNLAPLAIPERHYFIAGDNRDTDFELHTLGVVRDDQLAGVLLP